MLGHPPVVAIAALSCGHLHFQWHLPPVVGMGTWCPVCDVFVRVVRILLTLVEK